MQDTFSLDDLLISDRKSSFLIRLKGKHKRLGFAPGDLLVVDKNLPLVKDKPAVVVVQGKFRVDIVTEDWIKKHDPENGDFIWGMIRSVVRELK